MGNEYLPFPMAPKQVEHFSVFMNGYRQGYKDGFSGRSYPVNATIRLARIRQGMNQEDLAKAVGVSTMQISYIEAGKRKLSPEVENKIYNILGLSKLTGKE